MAQLLLDSNALIWLVGRKPTALLAIVDAQAAGTLYVSPATAWEIGLASQRKIPDRRPDLGGLDAATWFQQTLREWAPSLS